MKTLAERMRAALDSKHGASQAGLAQACGVAQPSVSNWFSGKTKSLKGASLLAAAKYLGVRPAWLESGLGKMRDDPTDGAAPGAAQYLQEPVAIYPLQIPWPFKSINPSDWEKLTESQKSAIEDLILSFVGNNTINQRYQA